jgi:outer membrane receptor protein involved in Fe transport
MSLGRLFTQAYLNTSNAGDSFLLRDGVPLLDKSSLFVTQAQHGFNAWNERQEFTYGVDYFHTMPRSEGTINGKYEDEDVMDEWGVYGQSETALGEKVDVVVAGRLDSHSELEDKVFSPRAALVLKPSQEQTIRLTYNRAYSNPTALNFFLDLSGGRAPDAQLAALGYRLRAQGVGSTGFFFRNPDGSLRGMRSPFNPISTGGPAQFLPVDAAANFWPAAVAVAAQGAAAAGTPLPASIVQLLSSLRPTSAQIGVSVLDPSTRAVSTVAAASIPDVPRTRPETSTTFEVGYQGILGGRLKLAADVWRTERKDFISPLTLRTPLLLLNGQQIGAFITPPIVAAITQQLIGQGVPEPQAQQQAAAQAAVLVPQLATGIGSVPVGVVSEPNINASGADLLVTYYNAGEVDMTGLDLAFEFFVNDEWTLGANASFVSDDWFEIEGGSPVSLNAPKTKGSVSLGYRRGGLSAEGRVRYTAEFPAQSAGYVGTRCITGGTGGIFEEDCVASSTLVDLSAGYQIPRSRATVQLMVSNVLDEGYRSFVGVPDIGRFALLRVKYDLR